DRQADEERDERACLLHRRLVWPATDDQDVDGENRDHHHHGDHPGIEVNVKGGGLPRRFGERRHLGGLFRQSGWPRHRDWPPPTGQRCFRDDDADAREYSPPSPSMSAGLLNSLTASLREPAQRLASTICRSSFFSSEISSRNRAATSNLSSAPPACICFV